MRKFASEHQDKVTTKMIDKFGISKKTVENSWSRNVLSLQTKSGLYAREGKNINNFKTTLPEAQSDLAASIIEDPYN